jgi:hypothetical protein
MAKSVGEQLDATFKAFEEQSEWRLSLPAKVIIQQAFISIEMDQLGMGEYAGKPDRDKVVQAAFSNLSKFLDHLKKEALNRPDDEKSPEVIGGIFVLQHIKEWKTYFSCPCWPN